MKKLDRKWNNLIVRIKCKVRGKKKKAIKKLAVMLNPYITNEEKWW